MYVVPNRWQCTRFPRNVVMLVNPEKQFVLEAPGQVLAKHESESTEHKLTKEY